MASFVMVVDPDYTGSLDDKAIIPYIPRSWAMRKLFKQGVPVGDIARRYKVDYHKAYKAIDPPRLAASNPRSTVRKPLTPERLASLPKSRLLKMAYVRTKDPKELKRIEKVMAELDRRFPGWIDEPV